MTGRLMAYIVIRMMDLIPCGTNVVAIALMVFGIYLPRHHRRDLAVAYIGVNIGVMAVTMALANTQVAEGLGLGLFGVLSIIRLRSDELAQHEVAYFFSALALGLLGGIGMSSWKIPALMALIVFVLLLVDTNRFRNGAGRQLVNLDRAITDPDKLKSYLAERLGVTVLGATVQRIDLVSDTTLVEVRYRRSARDKESDLFDLQLREMDLAR